MSGPKTSRYSLTLEMRRAMERARELERKTKAAYSQKESKRKEVMSLVSQLDKITERAEFISMQSVDIAKKGCRLRQQYCQFNCWQRSWCSYG